jgi:hypothetical protein
VARQLFLPLSAQALIEIWNRKLLFQQQVDPPSPSPHLTLNSFCVSSVILLARSEKRQDVPMLNIIFTFMVPCIIIHTMNKTQQDALLFLKS